ncbi:aspartyl/asparaginyl beta-hydroxylase isoform X3 [Megalops cyprinoides]|uniref:aspartyl/asparaginyl beta-hydroxylase isoform X3 n=1 Tax=Megalops cyprinoides TaxID=118141 RepID=UPI001864A696|nr:aspartyl/asparaginyl beta-hydroxylase isoform X3 [Megalops cyprinoides]
MGEPNAEVNNVVDESEAKPQSASKNGKKAEGGQGNSFFTWFMVLALLGVWTSVAVVWFDLVDYDDVLARAKEFRYNISEVLQGKLGAYDADGDGDFDVEDAKVLLGLKEKPAAVVIMEAAAHAPAPPVEEPEPEPEPETVVEEEIQPIVTEEVAQAPPEPEVVEDVAEVEPEEEAAPAVEEEVAADEAPEPEEIEAPEEEVVEEQVPEVEEKVEAVEEEAAPEAQEQTSEEVEEPVEEAAESEPEPEAEPEEAAPVEEEAPETEDAEEAAPIEEEAEPEASEIPDNEQLAEEDSPSEDDGEVQDAATVMESEDDVYGSQTMEVEFEIQAAVPLPELVEEDSDSADSAGDDLDAHPYEDNTEDVIDTAGEIVEDAQPEETEEEPQEESAPAESQLTEEADLEAESVTESEDEPAQEELLEEDQGAEESIQEEENPQEEVAEAQEEVSFQEEPAEEPAPAEEQPVEELTEEPAQPEGQHQDEPAGTADVQQEEKPKEKAKKKKPKLLNKFDKTIKAEIDAAEKLRKKGKVEEALRAFESLVQRYPQSPRSRYGKAQSEDDLAEKMRSNEILLRAINTYREAAELPNAPADLVKATLKRRAERQQFLGRMRGALVTLEKLVQIFPEDVSLKNDLGVGYLLLGDNKSAKKVYEEVLAMAPDDGFAKVHYGFILKSENMIAESIPFLREGLESGHQGTDDGRFYFHLGDALQRVGDDSAYKWYELGHKRGHFASVWQRSLYNVDGLKAQPWWTAKETSYTDLVKTLERNWKTIRDEALSLMDTTRGLFVPEDENLREKGEWGQFTLWQQGKKVENSCRSVPKTCALLERYPEATGCKRGQIKYSVMQPGTHVWPHTGPTNCRLRMHLGLVIPKEGCRIRCTNDTRVWEEGKVLIFDDSFEHEVWQEADSYRLIFIVDVWHPELTQYQRQTLSPI